MFGKKAYVAIFAAHKPFDCLKGKWKKHEQKNI